MSYDRAKARTRCSARLKAPFGCIPAGVISIEEKDPGGAGALTITTVNEAVLILPKPIAIKWLANGKCADGALLEFALEGAHLHIFELKTTLSKEKWALAKLQYDGMYLHAAALAAVLGVSNFSTVKIYIAYSTETITNFLDRNPVARKRSLGDGKALVPVNDWAEGTLRLADDLDCKVTNILRDAAGNASLTLHS